jgi:hypothetical protein
LVEGINKISFYYAERKKIELTKAKNIVWTEISVLLQKNNAKGAFELRHNGLQTLKSIMPTGRRFFKTSGGIGHGLTHATLTRVASNGTSVCFRARGGESLSI